MPDFTGLLPPVPGRELVAPPEGADVALRTGARRRAAKRQRAALLAATGLVAAAVAYALDGGGGSGPSRLEFVDQPPRPTPPAISTAVPGAPRVPQPRPEAATAPGRPSTGRATASPPGTVPASQGAPAFVPPPDTAVRDEVVDPASCVTEWCTRSLGPQAAPATGTVPIVFAVCRPKALVGTGAQLAFATGREVDVLVWRDADRNGEIDPATGPAWTWSRGRVFPPARHMVDVRAGMCVRWTVSWNLVEDGGRPAAGGYLVTVRVAIDEENASTLGDPQSAYDLHPLVVAGQGGEERPRRSSHTTTGPVVVEAESGTIETPLCGDDGPMQARDNTHASGGRTVFHPGSNCRQSFAAGSLRVVTSLRYYVTGNDGLLCGHFLFTGGIVGTTAVECHYGSTWVTVPVSAAHRVGGYSVTWITAPDTATNVNAFVDNHSGY